MKGFVFGGAYISLFPEGLIYGGKFAFQNRLGLYWEGDVCLKTHWARSLCDNVSNLQQVFTETRHEDLDRS